MNPTTEGPDLSGLKIHRDEPARPTPGGGGVGRWVGPIVLLAVVAAAALGTRAFLNRPPRLAVTTPMVSRSDLGNEMLSASGYVVSRRQARVGSKVVGRVDRMYVDEGSRVSAGQILASMDQGDLPAQLAQVEASLPQARNELTRQKALMARNLTTPAALDAADTRVRTLEAQVRVVESQQEQLAIRAPFAGTIILRNLQLGETVAPNGYISASNSQDRGFVIADLADLEVEADVNESNIAQLRPGQPCRVEVDALPGQGMEARIRMIQPTANRQKATVQAKVSILKPLAQVRPDMTAKVTFLKAGEKTEAPRAAPRIYVPESVVVKRGTETGVWDVQSGGILRWLPVETAPGSSGQLEIKSGLKGTESLVLKPLPILKEGSTITPAAESAGS